MSLKEPTYAQLLGKYYPEIMFSCPGNGSVYSSISSPSPGFPSQETLDGLKLTEIKALAKLEVNKYRLEWMTDYFTYDSKHWDCDDSGITNIIGTLLIGLSLGQVLPEDSVFRDHDNVTHTVTFVYMRSMAIALMGFKQSVYSHSWDMKAEIDALETVQEVIDYDVTVGWPAK